MAKFFIRRSQLVADTVTITGPDVQHISKVLRLRPGEMIQLADGCGSEYRAEITALGPDQVTALVRQRSQIGNEPPLAVYLFQGLPKGEKFDLIIQKCTEIGISKIFPVAADRSIVQLSREKEAKRRERWQRIATEAAKQSGRGAVPEVMPLAGLAEAFALLPPNCQVVMPWEGEAAANGLKKILPRLNQADPLVLLIGPEGGFSPTEVTWARERGAHTISLGPRILRTETAGLVALSLILYALGDLGGDSHEQ